MKSQNERNYEEGDTLRERCFSAETGTSQKVRSQASTAESVKESGPKNYKGIQEAWVQDDRKVEAPGDVTKTSGLF